MQTAADSYYELMIIYTNDLNRSGGGGGRGKTVLGEYVQLDTKECGSETEEK